MPHNDLFTDGLSIVRHFQLKLDPSCPSFIFTSSLLSLWSLRSRGFADLALIAEFRMLRCLSSSALKGTPPPLRDLESTICSRSLIITPDTVLRKEMGLSDVPKSSKSPGSGLIMAAVSGIVFL